MTNYERIKSMSVEKTTELFARVKKDNGRLCDYCTKRPWECIQNEMAQCGNGLVDWLQSEAEPTRWEKWIDGIKIEVPKRGARWQGVRSVAKNTQRPTKGKRPAADGAQEEPKQSAVDITTVSLGRR